MQVRTYRNSRSSQADMNEHHTKTKGDLAVLKIAADIAEQGWIVAFPATEHAPFDLIGYDGLRCWLIQVKYAHLSDGAVTAVLTSSWTDKHGNHRKNLDPSKIDLLAIYCGDTKGTYYLKAEECPVSSVRFRVKPSGNNQVKRVRQASEYADLRRLTDKATDF